MTGGCEHSVTWLVPLPGGDTHTWALGPPPPSLSRVGSLGEELGVGDRPCTPRPDTVSAPQESEAQESATF